METLQQIMTRPKRILLVDDDEVFRSQVGEYLVLEGAEPVCVENGSKAIEVFSHQDFDLVLMDIILPGMDGITTAKLMRQNDPYYPAIIFLTGYLNQIDTTNLMTVPGPIVLTVKPIHMPDLSRLVQTYARRLSYA